MAVGETVDRVFVSARAIIPGAFRGQAPDGRLEHQRISRDDCYTDQGSFSTDSVVSAAVQCLLFPETDLLTAWQRNDAKGHSTKSLRSSPPRGSKSREAGSQVRR